MHLRVGWWSLLLYLSLGVLLEALHGFKVRWYLDVSNETRRLMWTLAHAHGTLLSLIHMAFAVAVWFVPDWSPQLRKVASWSLCLAGFLIPLGFFFGGLQFHAGDPGIGILLLPSGAVFLFVSVLLTALATRHAKQT